MSTLSQNGALRWPHPALSLAPIAIRVKATSSLGHVSTYSLHHATGPLNPPFTNGRISRSPRVGGWGSFAAESETTTAPAPGAGQGKNQSTTSRRLRTKPTKHGSWLFPAGLTAAPLAQVFTFDLDGFSLRTAGLPSGPYWAGVISTVPQCRRVVASLALYVTRIWVKHQGSWRLEEVFQE